MKKFIVLFAAFAMVFAFAPVATADVDLYGSARMWTYRVNVDNVAPAFDDEDTVWRMGPFSRFGANFKSGDITGKMEFDARDQDTLDGASTLGDMRIRHLYGEWDFGGGKLLVGHTWPLSDWAVTSLQYTGGGLQSYGSVGMGFARTSQIRLTFGNLKIGFLAPRITDGAPTGSLYGVNTDTTLPKIEVRYGFKFDPVSIDLVGGWQSYDIVNAADQEKDITSYVGAVRVKMNFGAAYVNLGANLAQNGGQYGMSNAVLDNAMFQNGEVKDNESYGYCAAVGFKLSDMATLEAGYGKNESEDDRTTTDEDEAQAYYLLAKIQLAPGVMMYPEVGVLDGEDVTTAGVKADQAKTTFFGIVWKIDFK